MLEFFGWVLLFGKGFVENDVFVGEMARYGIGVNVKCWLNYIVKRCEWNNLTIYLQTYLTLNLWQFYMRIINTRPEISISWTLHHRILRNRRILRTSLNTNRKFILKQYLVTFFHLWKCVSNLIVSLLSFILNFVHVYLKLS